MTNALRVPKGRARVTLGLETGVEEAELFLSDFARTHGGPERVGDVLDYDDCFLPVMIGSAVQLVARAAIRWVRLAAEAYSDPLEEAGALESLVTLVLSDGSSFDGVVRFMAPSERARLLDFLNGPSRWIPLYEGDTVHLVNRAHVVRVVLREGAR